MQLLPQTDDKTRLCALIGDPLDQSPSPTMHNKAFQARRLNAIYLAFRISQAELESAVRAMKTLDALGFNVTIPYKEEVMTHLDRLEETAETSGAVNTVVNKGGNLVGHNTDIDGVLFALKRHKVNAKGSKALIIGAGGAARAFILALTKSSCNKFVIANRTEQRARRLAQEFRTRLGIEAKAIPLDHQQVTQVARSADIVVNATPIGSSYAPKLLRIKLQDLDCEKAVFDAVYNPMQTPLLRTASRAGAVTIYGYEMLVGQGAAAFKLWTGIDPPIGVMERAVLTILSEGAKA